LELSCDLGLLGIVEDLLLGLLLCWLLLLHLLQLLVLDLLQLVLLLLELELHLVLVKILWDGSNFRSLLLLLLSLAGVSCESLRLGKLLRLSRGLLVR